MPKQKGPLKLKGTIGDITFAKGKNGGYTIKEKSEVSAEFRAKGKQFKKFRDQQSEFGRGGKLVRTIREAFGEQVGIAKDFRLTQRLQKLIMQVVATDTVNRRGARSAAFGDLKLLEGFEFNADADWKRSINVNFSAVIDRAAGTATISLPGYIPEQVITAPEGSDHFRIVCAASLIDPSELTYESVVEQSPLIPIDYAPQAPLTLTAALAPNADKPIFLVLGIQFSQVTNGFEDLDVHGKFNALTIVKVDTV